MRISKFPHLLFLWLVYTLELTVLLPQSIQFNIVSKGLRSDRMSFYLSEAAGDIRDLLAPMFDVPEAKL